MVWIKERFPEVMFASSIILMVIPVSFYGKIALEWFILGAVLVKEQIHITALDYIPLSGLFSGYLLGAVASLFLDIAVVKNIFILIGVLFWIRLSKAIYSNEKLRSIFLRLSKWIFIIYVFHELTLSSVRKICQRLFLATPLILCAEYLMIPILVITGCIIAGIVLKKIMPRLYIVLTGERWQDDFSVNICICKKVLYESVFIRGLDEETGEKCMTYHCI